MYAIVKTGGKQYKVAPGDKLNIEKLNAEPGAKVELEAICVVDGEKVEADPAKAAATKVVAVVLEQFKGEKQLVFKFKKRKNYKKLRRASPAADARSDRVGGLGQGREAGQEGRREEGRGRRGAQGRNQGRCEVHGRQGEACRQDRLRKRSPPPRRPPRRKQSPLPRRRLRRRRPKPRRKTPSKAREGILMAHKKGLGSTRNGRDSHAQRLGVKMFAGQTVKTGNVIVRQHGTHHPSGRECRSRQGRHAVCPLRRHARVHARRQAPRARASRGVGSRPLRLRHD